MSLETTNNSSLEIIMDNLKKFFSDKEDFSLKCQGSQTIVQILFKKVPILSISLNEKK